MERGADAWRLRGKVLQTVTEDCCTGCGGDCGTTVRRSRAITDDHGRSRAITGGHGSPLTGRHHPVAGVMATSRPLTMLLSTTTTTSDHDDGDVDDASSSPFVGETRTWSWTRNWTVLWSVFWSDFWTCCASSYCRTYCSCPTCRGTCRKVVVAQPGTCKGNGHRTAPWDTFPNRSWSSVLPNARKVSRVSITGQCHRSVSQVNITGQHHRSVVQVNAAGEATDKSAGQGCGRVRMTALATANAASNKLQVTFRVLDYG